ncbi:collagen-like protein, partial [Weissella confusa]|nr:collagen-like protein [Weissella confusa]
VTKVNNLSVGGRNLLVGTSSSTTIEGYNSFNAITTSNVLAGGRTLKDIYNQYGESGYLTLSFDWAVIGSDVSGQFIPQWNNMPWDINSDYPRINPSVTNASGHYKITFSLKTSGYSTSTANGIRFRQDYLQGTVIVSNLKLEAGNVPTDWTPAPED